MKLFRVITVLLLAAVMAVVGGLTVYADEGDGGMVVGVVATTEGTLRLVVTTNSGGVTYVSVNDTDFNDLATQQGVANAIAAATHQDSAPSLTYYFARANRDWILEFGDPVLKLLMESHAGVIFLLNEQGEWIAWEAARVDGISAQLEQQNERLWIVEHHSLSSLEAEMRAEMALGAEQAQTKMALMESQLLFCMWVVVGILVFVIAGLGVALYRTKRINLEQKG